MAESTIVRLGGVVSVTVEFSDTTGRITAVRALNSSTRAGAAHVSTPSGTHTVAIPPGESEWRVPVGQLARMPLWDDLRFLAQWPVT